MNMREALERIAKYPMSRSEEMSIETAREIARAALASQAQQPTQEPVAWMNPYGGLLHVRETGLEKATFTIPLYLQSQAQQPTSEQVEQAVSLLKSLRGLCDVEDYPTIDGIISTLAAQAQQEIEIDMLTGDVTWKFNEAQTQEPLEIQALTTICKLLDGSQPKDPLGALFVAQSALRQSQAQQPIGEVQHYAAPANLPAYVNVKWYGAPPKNGAKVYALPPAPEGGK